MNAPSINDWKDSYRAALFETNKSKIPMRIADAEKRIAARARELFNSGDHDTLERSALNVAMYKLTVALPKLQPLERKRRCPIIGLKARSLTQTARKCASVQPFGQEQGNVFLQSVSQPT